MDSCRVDVKRVSSRRVRRQLSRFRGWTHFRRGGFEVHNKDAGAGQGTQTRGVAPECEEEASVKTKPDTKTGMRTRWVGVGMVLLGMLGAGSRVGQAHAAARVQSGGVQNGGIPMPGDRTTSDRNGDRNGERNEALHNAQEKQATMRNDERQRRLVADTDKLLALATELHADVAKTDKHVLSIDVIRRAEEIERLARGVKDRMKS